MVAASYWGPEAILYSTNGDPARSVPMAVRDAVTHNLVALYEDADRIVVAPNPIKTDAYGNLAFYIDSGTYDVNMVGSDFTFRIVVSAPSSGGGGGDTFEYVQPTPQSVWPVINHNRGYRPASVSVFSLDWSVQYDEFAVQHLNTNQLLISMDVPTAGRALM